MTDKVEALFECSWEVCNKVGGIWTVITSKAARIKQKYGDNYYCVGPYFLDKVTGQFQETVPPKHIQEVFDTLKKEGLHAHYGTWLVSGNPNTILIDFSDYWYKLNEIKGNLWQWGNVDSLEAGNDFNEPLLLSYATGRLIELLTPVLNKKIVVHCHEWLNGATVLYLNQLKQKIPTVFTTHATILGRSMAASGVDIYKTMQSIDAQKECYNHHIQAKHLLEKASAQQATIFTTVSEITGIEAEHLLERKPDVLLPNGLDLEKFPIFEEILIKHRLQRDRIREFMLSYFFPYYTFELPHTLFYFLAGRYEFRVKGIDIYIQALSDVNKQLKKEKSKRTIVAFIWVPAHIQNIKQELVENKTFFKDIQDSLDETFPSVKKNLLYASTQQKEISQETLFDEEFSQDLKKRIARFKKKGTPPLCTHDLHDHDIILQKLHQAGLTNAESDRVKVIYYPIYLSGADGLLDLNYYESMQGCHLGVFPSYYEPWGYTPLESGALGVPSITTDLSGFGRYFCSDCHQEDFPGVYVVKRFGHDDQDARNQLAEKMLQFAQYSQEERTKDKLAARKVTTSVDWKRLVEHYFTAHQQAADKQ